MKRSAWSVGVAMVLAVGLSVVAACSSSQPAADSEAGSGDDAYQNCLASHGVEMPQFGGSRPGASGSAGWNPSDRPRVRPSGALPSGALPSGVPPMGEGRPGGGFGAVPPSGVDASAWAKAQQACASLRPSREGPRGGQGDGVDAAYLNCLSEHGVTPSGGVRGLDSTDPETAAAMQSCAVLRPSPGVS